MSTLTIISTSTPIGALLFIMAVGLICWLLWWFIGYVALPEPFNKVCRCLVAFFAIIALINAIMSVFGTPLFRW